MFCPFFEGWSLVSFGNSGQIGNVHLSKLPLLNHIHFYGVFSWVMDLQCDAWVIWPHGVDHCLATLGHLIAKHPANRAKHPASRWCYVKFCFYWALLVNHNNCHASWCVHHLTYTWRMLMSNVQSLLDALWCTSQLPTSNMIVRQFRN